MIWNRPSSLGRAALPIGVFIVLFGAHVAWAARPLPAAEPKESCCADCAPKAAATVSGFERYKAEQDYFLGYSYALAGAFAAVSLRSFREKRRARGAVAGVASAGASGLLGLAGCWLVGCCGSPMLGVYVSLFGAAFLPFVKPVVAGITTVSILVAALLARRDRTRSSSGSCGCGSGASCSPRGDAAVARPSPALTAPGEGPTAASAR